MSSIAKKMLADKHFSLKIQQPSKEAFMASDSCTGRTTRIVDHCIQQLLETGSCHIQDHAGNPKADLEVLRRVKNRMNYEHPYFEVEYKDFTLTLKGVH